MEIIVGKEVRIDTSNENELTVKKIEYPLGYNYANCYWDGIKYTKGKTRVKKTSFGGGNGWARRGSMSESWDGEDTEFISIEEFNNLVNRVKEIARIENEVDREAEAREFVENLLEKE